ncbi:MAG: hypothetical protein COW30_05895 [Rhodospirillales bacterium CG15_BIG_FIL_POST_REV_8_21_14_020_66_15]|nr:MAG: hypothetical protein COW30_05895 [Rhodospirillales bacterium CG15_BIG_FIL_POST_REV_8_21_14_020_66_15]
MVLRRLCEGFDLRLLLLVRNQARYVVSMYGLHLQNGGQTGFNDYVAAFPYAHLDWLRVANTLAEFVGTDAVTVMPFEKELYPASGSSNGNFLEAFQNAMAISRPVKLETLPLVNPSLVPKYHATKLRANQGDDAEGAAATIPEGDAAYYSASKESPLSPEQAKAIMARYADTNRELFARYMPDFDATAYQPGGLT